MINQRIQDMKEKDKTYNLAFLLIKMKMYKDLGKEITLMPGQKFSLFQMSPQIILERLMHIRADKINWHQVSLSRLITLNMHHSIKSK